jgi:hypothetical protein
MPRKPNATKQIRVLEMIERRKIKAANDWHATYTLVLSSRCQFVAFISDKKGRQADRLCPRLTHLSYLAAQYFVD